MMLVKAWARQELSADLDLAWAEFEAVNLAVEPQTCWRTLQGGILVRRKS